MDLQTFKASIHGEAPPDGHSLALQALWQDAKGEWDEAHKLAQAQDDATGAWVHAYLHRVEGDLRNAGTWYKRADKPECTAPLAEEWDEIAAALLR
ncbi:MAG: hypothetical protein GKS00_05665 [Alphaproteobacteria bacterium]|nr:hypothetical protein [Alphaproteobacteria bacterium]